MTLSKALTVHVFDTEESKLSRLLVGYHVKRLSFQALEKGGAAMSRYLNFPTSNFDVLIGIPSLSLKASIHR